MKGDEMESNNLENATKNLGIMDDQKELFEEEQESREKLDHWIDKNGLMVVEKNMDKEKQLDILRKQMSICRGTGTDGDCDKHSLDDYNKKENKNIKIDERLVRFIVNEILKIKDVSGIVITSGFRCPQHNRYSVNFDTSNKTIEKSLHMEGGAFDYILLGGNGQPLTYQGYKNFKKIIESKNEYKFKPNEWKMIQEEQSEELDLTDSIDTTFFATSYNKDEGVDSDNDNDFSYGHVDLRGIKPKGLAKKYYDNPKLHE